mmetsp:Transcript_38672/g.122921  ORF Transcript_38672/g.122921 Transcript_38672/m.122921 type:complete len:170 (+) Transcript_38672:663-1172(+)
MRKIADSTSRPPNLSNIAWSFAMLSIQNIPLWQSISAAALLRCTQFAPQDVANLSWAMATCGLWDEPLLHALSSQALAKMDEFDAQNLSNTVWSMADIQFCHMPPLGIAAPRSALALKSEPKTQNLSNAARRLAKPGIQKRLAIFELSAAASTVISEFTVQDMSNTAWA